MINNQWGRLLLATLLWSVLGLLFSLPTLSASNWKPTLLGALALWWTWGLITPLIFRVDAHLPLREKDLGLRILAQLAISVVLTFFYVYVLAAVRALLGLGPWSPIFGTRLLRGAFHSGFLWSWLIYWLIFGALQTYRYYEHFLASELRLERMENSFSQARLNALRMQLDPHFLFNALNTVSAQVERDPRLARKMIEHLGDLLRLSLEARDRQEVPLAEEIAFLDHYIAIQKIRFGDSLRIETHVAAEVKYALVPYLIVQPLVENAIRHGISRRASGGAVTLTAQRRAERIEIRIVDDGVGLPPGWKLESSPGLGLSVTRQRLAGLHPNGSYSFDVMRRIEGGTEAKISLPLRMTGEPTNGHVER